MNEILHPMLSRNLQTILYHLHLLQTVSYYRHLLQNRLELTATVEELKQKQKLVVEPLLEVVHQMKMILRSSDPILRILQKKLPQPVSGLGPVWSS